MEDTAKHPQTIMIIMTAAEDVIPTTTTIMA